MLKIEDFILDEQKPCKHHGKEHWVLWTSLNMTQMTRTYYLQCLMCSNIHNKVVKSDVVFHVENVTTDEYKTPLNLKEIVGVSTDESVDSICDNINRIFKND